MPEKPIPGFRLAGLDGNSFAIIGRFTSSARRAGWTKDERDAVVKRATSGDYNNLLATFAPYEDDKEDNDA